MKKNEFVIEQTKPEKMKDSILSFGSGLVCLWCAVYGPKYIPFFGHVIIRICMSFFAVGLISAAVYFMSKRNDKRPLLVINEDGITDNTSALSVGFIPWKDIADIVITTNMGVEQIEIKLKNDKKYLAYMNLYQKIVIGINKSMGYTGFFINYRLTNYTAGFLMQKINEFRVFDDDNIQKYSSIFR